MVFMNKFTTRYIAASALSIGCKGSFAHEGHGMAGMHWHATDAWGFVAVAVMLAVAIWLSHK
jgi:hypothetical protein